MIKDFISVNVEGIQDDRQELCRLAHISTCTLWRMESEGLIHKMKFGRRNLYKKDEIDVLLASGKLAKYSQ